jgi:hypothetical protein
VIRIYRIQPPELPPDEIEADGVTQLCQQPLSLGQRQLWVGNAAAYRWEGELSTDLGDLVVWAIFDGYDEADAWAGRAAAWVGRVVALQWDAETLSPLPVSGVHLDVEACDRGVVATLRLRFDAGPNGSGGGAAGPQGDSLATVAISDEWGTWSDDEDLWCYDAALGLGTYLGDAVVQTRGEMPRPVIGHYVRISVDGTPVWHGDIHQWSATYDRDRRLVVSYRCAGLGRLLEQRHILRWWESNADTLGGVAHSSVRDPGDLPPFGIGDQALHDIDGTAAWVHARGQATAGEQATVRRVLESLTAHLNAEAPAGPVWSLDAAAAPAVIDAPRSWEFRPDATVLEVLDAVCRDAGCAWSIVVVDGQPAIVVHDLLAAGAPIDLSDIDDRLDLSRDETQAADEGYVAGPHAWVASTLGTGLGVTGLGGGQQLVPLWTADQRTAWDAADDEQRATDPYLQPVGRRFGLAPGWQGQSHEGSNRRLPYGRAVDAQGQETGAWAGQTVDPPWPAARVALRFDHALPMHGGQQLDLAQVSVIEPPDLVRFPPLPIQVYRRLDDEFVPVDDWQLRITDDAAAIELGSSPDHSQEVLDRMAADWAWVVTLAWAHPLRPRVSRLRAAPARDLPRQAYRIVEDESMRQTWYDQTMIVRIDDGPQVLAPGQFGLMQVAGADFADRAAQLAGLLLTGMTHVAWTLDGCRTLGDALVPVLGTAISQVGIRPEPEADAETVAMERCLVGAVVWNFRVDSASTTVQADTALSSATGPAVAGGGADARGLADILAGSWT